MPNAGSRRGAIFVPFVPFVDPTGGTLLPLLHTGGDGRIVAPAP